MKSLEELLQLYIDSLTSKEKLSYEIAKQQLGSSFQLEKSAGFLKWLSSQPKDSSSA
jgi:hypothetical protein